MHTTLVRSRSKGKPTRAIKQYAKKLFIILGVCLSGQIARGEKVVSLQQEDLADIPGKEGLMVAVEIAPGEGVPRHRHNSDVFVYVFSGTIVTQVQGQPAKTLHAGATFFEAPADIHVDSRNPSNTVPTRLLVFFVKDKGVPPTIYLAPHSPSH